LSNHPVGAARRLDHLTGPDAVLMDAMKSDETDEGHYYLALRAWPHPDVEDAWTLSLRYAYLTKGDGSDGWTDEGMNMRVNGDPLVFLQTLAKMFAGSTQRFDGDHDPMLHDATEAE
jgi:hypothetical protein